MKKLLILSLLIFFPSSVRAADPPRFWPVQSIDTMKYSRDIARQYLRDAKFDEVIDAQVKAISETGATHVALGTPYDQEFVPFLSRWVKSARKYHLSVWFRGNLSGWENWFDYPDLSADDHTQKILEFIRNNKDIFADGDIFTSCPECENGTIGDPRNTGKVAEYRQFLISEHRQVDSLFRSLGKKLVTNYYSMNADVARLVMDRETTRALGGVVTLDHYVATAQKLSDDISAISQSSGGQIVLGEFGAPIPDIHGRLDEKGQSEWIASALKLLVKNPSLIGMNYWTSFGSSTALWNSPGRPRAAVSQIQAYFSPKSVNLTIINTIGKPLFANLIYLDRGFTTDKNGFVSLPWPGYPSEVAIRASGYKKLSLTLTGESQTVSLDPEQKNWWYTLQGLTYRFARSIMRLIK